MPTTSFRRHMLPLISGALLSLSAAQTALASDSSIEAYERYVRGGPALGDRGDIDVANRALPVVR